jgi:branched-chain amino acid transport system permease protein
VTRVTAAGAAVCGLVALLPLVASPYFVAFVLVMLMYVALAASWNVISGFAGYISFGHVAFFGIGAYVAALLMTRHAMSWPAASLLGGGAAALAAVALGVVCLRLKGPFFAIAMLGLSETLRVLASYWDTLTGGGFGISLPPVRDITPFYLAMLALAAAGVLGNLVIASSRFGLQLLAIREDEGAAEAVGVNTTACKVAAFVLSAVLPGVAGGVYARYVSYIEPQSVFFVFITAQMVVMTIFGGRGTVVGPVVGVVVLSTVAEVFWANFPFVHRVLYGALIVAIVLGMPDGLVEMLKTRGLLPRTRLI